jgi:hypothetical protein
MHDEGYDLRAMLPDCRGKTKLEVRLLSGELSALFSLRALVRACDVQFTDFGAVIDDDAVALRPAVRFRKEIVRRTTSNV